MSVREPVRRTPALWLVVAVVGLASLASGGCGADQPADPRAAVELGDRLVAERKFGQAVAAYQVAVRAEPGNGAARAKLGDAMWEAAQWVEGAQQTIRAADLLPDDQGVQLRAASRALGIRRFSEAARRATAVLQAQPGNTDALVVLANALAQIQDYTWALYVLRTKVRRADALEAALREVRPTTSRADDERAERLLAQALQTAPDRFETRAAYVNYLWATGRLDEASDRLRQIADQNPGHAVINEALGEYYLSRGRQDDGETYLKRAAAGGDRAVRHRLVAIYRNTGREHEALAQLNELGADTSPGDVSVPRAAILCSLGRYGEALEIIDALLERLPIHGAALETKAGCLIAAGKAADALVQARAAVAAAPLSAAAHHVLGRAHLAAGAVEDAFAEFTEAVRLDPSDRPASRALARLALETGRPAIAAELARELVRTDPADEGAAVTLVAALVRLRDFDGAATALRTQQTRFSASADLFVQEGDLRVARGTPGARAAYERALALDHDSVGALAGLVAGDLAEKRVASARQRIERMLSGQPDRPEYLLLLAQVLQAAGDVRGSEATYHRILARHPGHTVVALELSALLQRSGREPEARTVLEQLLQRRPGATAVRVTLGTLYEQAGLTTEAQTHYEKALADDPREAVAAYKLASLQVERGENLDVALTLAVKAVRALPDDPGANDAVGWIYVRKNLPRAGIPYLESSVRSAPEEPTFRYHLGVAYLAIGRHDNGRRELARALELRPTFRFATQARAALNQTPR